MPEIKIGLIGLGTVGKGVLDIYLRQRAFFTRAFGFDVHLATIAEKDQAKIKDLKVERAQIVGDCRQVIEDPSIQVVVELIGGATVAKDVVLACIAAGKHVVTANKHLLAKFGHEIFPTADKAGVSVYFEASVGGGMPVIKVLREGLVANDIQHLQCIINGTTNYILTRIRNERKPFDKVLADAQAKGYAEADPTFDVDGIDAAHKVAIMASLAYGCWVNLEDIYVEGIRHITPEDVAYAEDLGYVIKLLGIIKHQNDQLDVRVHPAMLPRDHLLANVNGTFNGVSLLGDAVDSILLTGRGAGRYPTASAVMGDVIDVCRNIVAKGSVRVPMGFYSANNRKPLVPIQDIDSRYYLRFTVVDMPGVLAKLTAVLGESNVSIASVVQKERAPSDQVPVVILTHRAREKSLRAAIVTIDQLDAVKRPTQVIRIEEEGE